MMKIGNRKGGEDPAKLVKAWSEDQGRGAPRFMVKHYIFCNAKFIFSHTS